MIAEAVDTSLARLQTDYIDLYQIHWPQRNVPMFGATEFDPSKEKDGPPIREQVEGMAAMIKAGKIRHYGLSNETAWGVCEFHRAAKELGVPGPGHAAEQLQPDLAQRRQRSRRDAVPREDVAARLQPARGGHSLRQISGRREAGRRALHAVRFARHPFPQAHGRRKRWRRTRRSPSGAGMTLVQLALGYVASRWFLGASIIGATSMAQLKEDIAAAQFTLDAETLEEIRKIQLRYPNPAA